MSEITIIGWGLGVVGSLCVAGIVGGVGHSYKTHGRISAIENEQENVCSRLGRIETKLDKLVDRWLEGDDE